VIYYVLLVAVLNLGLGFAVAVYRGRRCRRLSALAAEGIAPVATSVDGASLPEVSAEPAVADGADPSGQEGGHEEQLAQDEPSRHPIRQEDAKQARPSQEQPSQEELSHQRLGQPSNADPSETASSAGELPDEHGEPNTSAEPDCESASLEDSLQELRDEVEQYYRHVTQIDDQLRSCAEAFDTTGFESCLSSLQAAGQEYLESRKQAEAAFKGLQGAGEEYAAACDSLEVAVQRQNEQIRGTNEVIESLDYRGDPDGSCQQMVSETVKLMDVNRHLRDTLEEASVVVARSQQRLQSLDEAARRDPLTGLASRTGLEAELAAWWEQDPRRVRQLCIAMVDVDKFAEVNRRFGHAVGDRVLRAIAQLLAAESREDITAARFSGQRFLMLFGDADVRSTTSVIERIRQTVEIARLHYREDDIRITVSCAVAEATSKDTSETLYGHLETALGQAKRYGRNRTFIHEGEYPTPVVPPSFSLKEKVIPV